MSSPHRIPRTGLPPLVFEGDLLAEASSERHDGPLNSRWQELALYATTSDRYAAVVHLITRWHGEGDIIHAQHAATLGELVAFLQGVDPLQGAFLPPPHNVRLERQAETIRRTITLAWKDLVGRVLDEAGLEELV